VQAHKSHERRGMTMPHYADAADPCSIPVSYERREIGDAEFRAYVMHRYEEHAMEGLEPDNAWLAIDCALEECERRTGVGLEYARTRAMEWLMPLFNSPPGQRFSAE